MPTARCSCGQELHYSADKVGLIARCRCGRPVRLPEPKPEPPPKTYDDLLEEARRAASKRRQVVAVLAVAFVTIVSVLVFARFSAVKPARQQVAPETAVEPP